jgi:hypothetical protein
MWSWPLCELRLQAKAEGRSRPGRYVTAPWTAASARLGSPSCLGDVPGAALEGLI